MSYFKYKTSVGKFLAALLLLPLLAIQPSFGNACLEGQSICPSIYKDGDKRCELAKQADELAQWAANLDRALQRQEGVKPSAESTDCQVFVTITVRNHFDDQTLDAISNQENPATPSGDFAPGAQPIPGDRVWLHELFRRQLSPLLDAARNSLAQPPLKTVEVLVRIKRPNKPSYFFALEDDDTGDLSRGIERTLTSSEDGIHATSVPIYSNH
jgi:hypothetical protein